MQSRRLLAHLAANIRALQQHGQASAASGQLQLGPQQLHATAALSAALPGWQAQSFSSQCAVTDSSSSNNSICGQPHGALLQRHRTQTARSFTTSQQRRSEQGLRVV